LEKINNYAPHGAFFFIVVENYGDRPPNKTERTVPIKGQTRRNRGTDLQRESLLKGTDPRS
jgi:hypothetical protein